MALEDSYWEGIRHAYREAGACVWLEREVSESFVIGVRMKQVCVMSPWLNTV